MDLGVIEIKGYTAVPKDSGLESHHHMQFKVITRTLVGWLKSTDSSRWVTRRLAVVSMARIGSGVSRLLDIPRVSRLSPSSEGIGLSPGAWGAPFWGMPKGPETFWGMLGGSGLRPCSRTHLKRPCAILVRLVGRPTNTVGWWWVLSLCRVSTWYVL